MLLVLVCCVMKLDHEAGVSSDACEMPQQTFTVDWAGCINYAVLLASVAWYSL